MSIAKQFETTWDLASLLPHPESPEFKHVLEAYEVDLRQLADDSERLPSAQNRSAAGPIWAEFLERAGELFARTEDLHSFVGCHAAADASNKEFQRLEGVLAALSPLREQILMNLELALRELSEADFEAFVSAQASLKRVGFFLRECRQNARFRLPKSEELLAAQLAVDGMHAWGRLYDRLSGELRVEVMEKGLLVRKSPGQVSLDSPERTVRENNFFASQRAWATIADTCADALNHLSGSRLTKYARLGMQDHLELPLRMNRMRRETLDAMWSAITERKGVLTKYLNRKAELLGIERLCWYDVAAPLPMRRPGAQLTYDDACATILTTFRDFSPELADFAERAMAGRWIEAEDRSGKRQGGFCTGFPTRQQSRIFMTFTNSENSMSTLAHELGHAYHSYVLRDQPFLLQDYPMNLAETASTLAEAILGEQRLAEAEPDQRLVLLDQMLGDGVAFLMNIHARFLFEDRFHQERRQGELSSARFSELMLNAQREAYCHALADDGWYSDFWISKLHFYISRWPFYNFPYTFGYLLSLGIMQQRGKRDDFPDRVRQFLIATGSEEAETAVATAFGEDLTARNFWLTSLAVIEERVDQFLRTADEV